MSIPTSDNKLDVEITPRFKPDQNAWDKWETESINSIQNTELEKNEKPNKTILPHERSLENIIINIRQIFFLLLNKTQRKENITKFILDRDENIFYVSILLIIIGICLLLFSNILN